MTPTEQDKELRDKLTKLISQDGWVDTQEVDVDGQVNELVALITADRKRVALEARIDELKSLPVNWESCYDNTLRKHYSKVYDDVYNKRLAELKAQQEEV